MPLFLLGFLPKGSQQLACQLLNCLFATDTKGINYLFIKILLLLFLIALGFNLTNYTGVQCGAQPEKLRSQIRTLGEVGSLRGSFRYKTVKNLSQQGSKYKEKGKLSKRGTFSSLVVRIACFEHFPRTTLTIDVGRR